MSNSLKIFYQNTRGLRTKICRGLKETITLRNYHIVCITESWLSNNFNSESIFDDDAYVTHRADRTPRTYPNYEEGSDLLGGGALIAIKRNISATRVRNWESEVPFDNVWLKINKTDSKKIFINCIYINHETNFDRLNLYLTQLQDIMNTREPDAQFFIIGDFNLSCIEWFYQTNQCIAINYQGRLADELLNTITLTNTKQINSIKNDFNRILDLTLTNIDGLNVKKIKGIVKEDPYHPALAIHLSTKNIQFMRSTKANKLNFFKADYTSIKNELNLTNWENEFEGLNTNEATNKFYLIIRKIIAKHTPIIKPKSDSFPRWFSRELIELVKQKEIYFKLKKATNSQIYKQLYFDKRKEVKRLKKKNLREYQVHIESLIKTNPKCFFAYTKSLRKSNKLPTSMHLGNEISENMRDTANLFAKRFSEVYATHNPAQPIQCNNECENYFDLNGEDIRNIITSLDSNKNNSPDGIPAMFYKQTVDSIIVPLMYIFKTSLREMVYPDAFKLSYITPIHKSGSIDDIVNYRPISILPTAAKIFDKIIYNHMYSKTAHLITSAQHGFTAGKSTLTNLIEYTDYLINNIMRNGQIHAIYMDLAKAFDRINHKILIRKLKLLPISTCLVALIQSYLSNRKQIVCLYGEKSECIIPQSSVPQGSILSPLLFALFMNDLPCLIKTNILLFADDLKLFCRIKSIEDVQKLQTDINTIFNWCEKNDLQLNRDKCYFIAFSKMPESSQFINGYTINGTSITKVNLIRDLGIIFDSKLTFEPHFKHIVKTSFKMLGFISRSLYKFRNIETYTTLYNSYVRSITEYCASVWSPYYQTHIDSIERIQKKFTRMIFRKFHYPYECYEMRLRRLEMLSLEDRRRLIDEFNLYKINNGTLRLETTHNFQYNPIRQTRNNSPFYLPFVITNVEFYAPLLRMHRQHLNMFRNVNLNEPLFNAFKRYAIHEIKITQVNYQY